jgi:hypothetical protein
MAELKDKLTANGETLSDYREAKKDVWPELFREFNMTLGKSEESKLMTRVINDLDKGSTQRHTDRSRASRACLCL